MCNTKFIKVISFILLFSCISALFVGCAGKGTETEDDNLTDKEKFIKQIKRDFDSCEDGGTIELTLEFYAQAVNISAVYPMDFKLIDGNIYLDDRLYDNIKIASRPDFSEVPVYGIDTEDKIATIVKKIKEIKTCYVLETDESFTGPGEVVAVYVIDGTYYFAAINGSYGMDRIWRINK